MPSFKAYGQEHPRAKKGARCWCCDHLAPAICDEIRSGFAAGLTSAQAVAWLKDTYKIVIGGRRSPFKDPGGRLRAHLRKCERKPCKKAKA